jgi:hypothetical protein
MYEVQRMKTNIKEGFRRTKALYALDSDAKL